ncbi:uncharacterized protein LAESUDRAFT_756130 [Laetiporus sulphureus 93-53]|uniref:Uncharacterized protein n=1 Tax=Laetiporus sulphureus 93-53 TaxID=1314785 RepID=A0A165G6W1_9APHY|nr:uncharacterized protein LAESUDRAFT_756130 [Laetiporus sulphureus 93-53]KZT09909.1 hypothetical protein LAESUDRAFT_756130 [Laetiporus sulphureus 93-53]
MSSAHPHIVGAVTDASPLSPEDDDDDICPVCESECTCQNRAAPTQSSTNNASIASARSTLTSNASTASGSATTTSLKIKLTLPPSLKFGRRATTGPVGTGVSGVQQRTLLSSSPPNPYDGPASSVFTGTNAHLLAASVLNRTAPKRRGRPPKAIAASREEAKAPLLASRQGSINGIAESDDTHGSSSYRGGKAGKGKQVGTHLAAKKNLAVIRSGQKHKGKTTIGRKASAPKYVKNPIKSFSDDAHSERFPTFVSAASTSSHTSSSDSSGSDSDLSSLDSEVHEETLSLRRGEFTKGENRRVSNEGKRHDHASSSWEIRPRQSSVGLDEEDADIDSSASSGDHEDSETDSESDVADDADEDADTEGGGLEDVDDDDTSSRIGVTFGDGGPGWSDDEESSLDADLFFANLDDSSSESESSPGMHVHDPFDPWSDSEPASSMSADEEDALFLMDIDPSVQVRRAPGEFEFGLELDGLSFGWDGHIPMSNTTSQNLFDLGLGLQAADGDVDMQNSREDDTQSESGGSETVDDMLLKETDGETTEDELVDSDGLPNSRAMMLFRWPTTVSAIDPLSTVGTIPSSPELPPNASESVRIALASFPAKQTASAPTPADILSGRISLEDLEDMEMEKSAGRSYTPFRKHASGAPAMGEFNPVAHSEHASAVIDGKGGCVPSPFPRSQALAKRRRKRLEADCNGSGSGAVDPPSESALSSTQSSDETFTQSQVPTSEAPSTDAIDLDDVLDPSFLDPEPIGYEHDTQSFGQLAMASSVGNGALIRNLSRWDRIPMATFRRTRESAIASNMEGSASDTGLSVFGGMSSLSAMLAQSKPNDKKSRRHSKSKSTVQNDLLTRDGDRTPTPSSGHQAYKASKKELRREKAMMKRKMMAKPAQYRHQQPHRTHHHHPNHKSRAASSMQRGSGNSSGPSFGL